MTPLVACATVGEAVSDERPRQLWTGDGVRHVLVPYVILADRRRLAALDAGIWPIAPGSTRGRGGFTTEDMERARQAGHSLAIGLLARGDERLPVCIVGMTRDPLDPIAWPVLERPTFAIRAGAVHCIRDRGAEHLGYFVHEQGGPVSSDPPTAEELRAALGAPVRMRRADGGWQRLEVTAVQAALWGFDVQVAVSSEAEGPAQTRSFTWTESDLEPRAWLAQVLSA